MMQAERVRYDPQRAVVTAAGAATNDVLRTVARRVHEFDVVAGDDVTVRATSEFVEVETLTEHPLLVHHASDGVIRVFTTFRPDAEVEMGGLKEGVPARPIDEAPCDG